MKLKIISNIYSLQGFHKENVEIELYRYPKNINSLLTVLRMFIKSFRYDYILLNFTPFDIFVLALLKLVIPFNRCKLISLDLILTVPMNWRQGILCYIKGVLLNRAHLFLIYFKRIDGYQQYFHLRPEKFRYIPYKINSYEAILNTIGTDEGYIFCGGKSRRDFQTLIRAAREFRYPIKIVTPMNAAISQHGSFLDESHVPPNVEVIHDDGAPESFIKLMAASRLVVLPIKKQNISSSGLGVYIMAMALKKCVVISAGPGVDDVIPEGAAIMIPPEDVDALLAAIEKAYNDHSYRQQVAECGYRYSKTLEGGARFIQSIAECLCEDALKTK